jgi:hypothetical protein
MMGTVSASKDKPWMLTNLIQQKFIEKLEGKTVNNPKEFMGTPEAKTALEEAQKEVEEFLGYTMEEVQKQSFIDNMMHELKWASKPLSGEEELQCDAPESIMD